jgi:hypothetical protein
MIELTPADVLRLRALGVKAEPDVSGKTDNEIIAALNEQSAAYYDALKLAVQSERLAWAEARRWRLWGCLGLLCAAASIAATLLAAIARRGGW